MSLNNLSTGSSGLGRREEALAAIRDAVDVILPHLERAPYLLPDSGLKLERRYVEAAAEAGQEPDTATLERLVAVLERADVVARHEPDEP